MVETIHRLAWVNPRAPGVPLAAPHHAASGWTIEARRALLEQARRDGAEETRLIEEHQSELAQPARAVTDDDALPHFADLRDGALLPPALPSWSWRRLALWVVVALVLWALLIVVGYVGWSILAGLPAAMANARVAAEAMACGAC